MKFVLILGVALLLQGVVPCEGGKLFAFFHNFLARRATTIINRFRNGETGPESFSSFFRDLIEARLFAKGRLGWNETKTVPPSTTPQITTPLSEINYWRNVSSFKPFLSFFSDFKLFSFVRKCFFRLKVWQKNQGCC